MEPAKLARVEGPADQITLSAGSASCTIKLFGATITDYSVHTKPILFLSRQAILDGTKPIRGGIPLVFPFFGAGDGTLPSHGFARISTWTLAKSTASSAVLTLSSADVRTPWPYKFALEYSVSLTERSLSTSLSIQNTDQVAWPFQALLHTYFSVADSSKIAVSGLDGLSYIDQVQQRLEHDEVVKGDITIAKETDWIVRDVPGPVVLKQGGHESVVLNRRYALAGKPLPSDVVVWNPFVEKSKKMADFGDDEYVHMICLEPGVVSRKPHDVLKPGEVAVLEQELVPRF